MSEGESKDLSVQGRGPQPDSMAELESFNQIIAAIRRLPEESQLRVVKSAITFLGWADAVGKQSQGTGSSGGDVALGTPSSFSEDRNLTPKAFLLEKKAPSGKSSTCER